MTDYSKMRASAIRAELKGISMAASLSRAGAVLAHELRAELERRGLEQKLKPKGKTMEKVKRNLARLNDQYAK